MIRDRQRLTREAINTLDDLFYVFSTEGEPLFWNTRVTEVTGYTDAEIAEMAPTDFFPAEHRQRVGAGIQRALEDGQAKVEADILTKDGKRIPYEFSGGSLTDDAGDLIGFTGIGRDITERKERERKVRERTREFQGVLDSVDAAIWIRDLDSRFSLVNKNFRELFGISDATEIAGLHPSELLPEELAAQFVANDQRAIEAGERIQFEEEVDTADGVKIYQTRIAPLYDDGEMFATCGIATNITELRESQRELERINEQLEELVGIVSHDLRNPLSVASGRITLAKDSCDSEHLEIVERALDRMAALIEDMLTLAREGKLVKEEETVTLAELVQVCWSLVDTADASLVVETDQAVQADESRVQQLLENLIRNAVEHGGPDVTVTLGELEDGFFLEDDGPGIPLDDRNEVFDTGYTTSSAGTGFGLNIVKQIADAHGWSVRVMDGSDGGARFEITGVEWE